MGSYLLGPDWKTPILQSLIRGMADWRANMFLRTYINICAFPHFQNAYISGAACLENSVTQEYCLVLEELASVPNTVISFLCKFVGGERSVKEDTSQQCWGIRWGTSVFTDVSFV